MHFLIDADLPRAVAALCRSFGHTADDVRDIGLGPAPDSAVAAHAAAVRACLVTGDFDFADVRNYPPEQYSGIIVLRVPHTATTATILSMMEQLLLHPDLVAHLPGRLAIVDNSRVRLRPPIDPQEPA